MKTNYIFKSLCALAVSWILAGCVEDKLGDGGALKGIELESESFKVRVESSAKFHAYPVPWNCTDYDFQWSSSNSEVAKVNSVGQIDGLDVGTATITVSQGSISKTFTVEVYENYAETLPGRLEALGAKGLWLFEDADNLLKASIGSDLIPVGSGFVQSDGPSKRKKAITIPSSQKVDNVWNYNHFRYNHGFSANGGGKKVNEYTIVVDCNFPGGPTNANGAWQNGKYYSLFQTALDNTSDGDFFWRPSANFGVTGSYTKQDHLFVKDTWYRFVVSVKLGSSIRYYLNGQYYEANSNGDVDADRAWLLDGVLLFADEDGEDGQGFPLYVSTLAVFDRALSEDEVKSLGGL